MGSSLHIKPDDPETSLDGRHGKRSVKLVSCIIRAEKVEAVTEALNKLNLVGGMTVSLVRGQGSEKGETEYYRGARFVIPYIVRAKLEVAIETSDVAEVESVVNKVARTGHVGDGKIFTHNVVDLMRVRTLERGVSAL